MYPLNHLSPNYRTPSNAYFPRAQIHKMPTGHTQPPSSYQHSIFNTPPSFTNLHQKDRRKFRRGNGRGAQDRMPPYEFQTFSNYSYYAKYDPHVYQDLTTDASHELQVEKAVELMAVLSPSTVTHTPPKSQTHFPIWKTNPTVPHHYRQQLIPLILPSRFNKQSFQPGHNLHLRAIHIWYWNPSPLRSRCRLQIRTSSSHRKLWSY